MVNKENIFGQIFKCVFVTQVGEGKKKPRSNSIGEVINLHQGISFLVVNFVFFVAKKFDHTTKDTKRTKVYMFFFFSFVIFVVKIKPIFVKYRI